jgi:hypothetical protein
MRTVCPASWAAVLVAFLESLHSGKIRPMTKTQSASAPEAGLTPHHTVWDRFDSGFTVGTADARWTYFSLGPWVTHDGVATTSPAGLRVVAKGKHPTTGEPAYSLTLPPEKVSGGPPGQFDHCKWLVFANHLASTGVPGFDAVRGQELSGEVMITGRTFGTRGHPFGAAVRNPEDDLRLAMCGQNMIDFETGLVFDFMFSNERVYALYERLSYARTPQRHYAAFTYTIPVARRTPDSTHRLKIAYDRTAGVVRWVLDGQEVFRVDRVGRHIDPKWLVGDHGGDEEDVEMRQLNFGLGLFTLLDACQDGRGLVRLASDPSYYVVPQSTEAGGFVDEQSLPGSRLFGQGAELRVQQYVIASTERPSRG